MRKRLGRIRVCLCACIVCALSSCGWMEQQRKQAVVAECCGNTLTLGEIDALTRGVKPEDSARIADEYIQKWAMDALVYDKAIGAVDKRIESMVEDYRRELYIHEYEKQLVNQRMPQLIEDTLVLQYYEAYKQQLLLSEMILKGMLVIVPNGAPNLPELRTCMKNIGESDSMEWIEKYIYQYGVGYEFFVEDWKELSEVAMCLPIDKRELDRMVRQKRQIELQDSVNIYLLQVENSYSGGMVMPLDFARKEIEQMILAQRMIDFLNDSRLDLYNKALKSGILKRYED